MGERKFFRENLPKGISSIFDAFLKFNILAFHDMMWRQFGEIPILKFNHGLILLGKLKGGYKSSKKEVKRDFRHWKKRFTFRNGSLTSNLSFQSLKHSFRGKSEKIILESETAADSESKINVSDSWIAISDSTSVASYRSLAQRYDLV